MPLQTANWEPNKEMPVGKGATVQQFFTTLGKDRLEINVALCGAIARCLNAPASLERRKLLVV